MRCTTSRDGGSGDGLLLKIGIHEGPCLAVVLDKRQDYFGRTVNIAARVQDLAELALDPGDRVRSSTIPELAICSKPAGSEPVPHRRALRGVAEEMAVYEIP